MVCRTLQRLRNVLLGSTKYLFQQGVLALALEARELVSLLRHALFDVVLVVHAHSKAGQELWRAGQEIK